MFLDCVFQFCFSSSSIPGTDMEPHCIWYLWLCLHTKSQMEITDL